MGEGKRAKLERTYSFRAGDDLGGRVARARADFAAIVGRDPEIDAWIVRETEMAFARRARRVPETTRDQSAFMRAAVEILVGVTERVREGLELEADYRAAQAEDREKERFADASLESMARAQERDERTTAPDPR